ncbi:hypothetical protein [Streptomyces sp. RKAG293]|uniref:hypothetical protein n=1 Tax=Streptomyces sp. RKAG293 TaxID=2893403 RepID=UPI0020347CD2|nr:hypothetical protein [Streptomyces sp. RKAG293]MCM2416570.1 hypothetical protein [Streptomyces sp. RKAG293]
MAATWSATTGPTASASGLPSAEMITLGKSVAFGSKVLLGMKVQLAAGESRRIWSQVNAVDSLSESVEFDAGVQCIDANGIQVGASAYVAKNHTSTGPLALNPSLLFTAPVAGTYTCRLIADGDGRLSAVPGSSWLMMDRENDPAPQWVQSPDCDSRGSLRSCTYVGGPSPEPKELFLLGNDGTPRQSWKPTSTATAIAVDGNAELTTCFHGTLSCAPANWGNSSGSTVRSHAEAVQLNATGGACRITASPDVTSVITNSTHHYSIPYSLKNVPVATNCGSRNFLIRIDLALVSGNPVKVDGSRRDDIGEEAETYAFAVSSQTMSPGVADNGVFQDQGGFVSTFSLDGVPFETMSRMLSGTRPSIARLSTGGFKIAFVDTSGQLWVQDAGIPGGTGTPTGHKLWPGTSPSIAADSAGGWMVTFQDDTSRLWTLDSAGHAIKTNSAMNTGTDPSIAHLSTGGYEIAFVGSDGKLYSQDAGIPGGTSHPIGHIPASSPAIAADANGGWKIAFEGNTTNHLITYDSHGVTNDTTAIMWPSTSPAITALPTGGYETAINAWDGQVWEVGDGGNRPVGNGLTFAPGTSPTIATPTGSGFEIAFHSAGNHLVTVFSDDNTAIDTKIILPANASPTID